VDADCADLFAEPIRANDEHIVRPRLAPLEVVRRRVRARDDLVAFPAETEIGEATKVVIARGGGVVRREVHAPAGSSQAVERLARVGQHVRTAIEHAVHVEDRDRHWRESSA